MPNPPASPLYQVYFCFESGGRKLPFIKPLHSPPETVNAPSTFQAHIPSQAEQVFSIRFVNSGLTCVGVVIDLDGRVILRSEIPPKTPCPVFGIPQPGNKVIPFKFSKLDFIDPDVQQATPLANPGKIGTITLRFHAIGAPIAVGRLEHSPVPPLGPTTMAETVKKAGPHHISMTETRTLNHDVHVGYRQPGPDFLIASIRYMPEEHLRADGLLEPRPRTDFGIGWYDKKNMQSLSNAAGDIQRALQHLDSEHNTPYAPHNQWGHAIPHHTQRVGTYSRSDAGSLRLARQNVERCWREMQHLQLTDPTRRRQ